MRTVSTVGVAGQCSSPFQMKSLNQDCFPTVPDAAGVANRRFRPPESGFFDAYNVLGENGGRDRD